MWQLPISIAPWWLARVQVLHVRGTDMDQTKKSSTHQIIVFSKMIWLVIGWLIDIWTTLASCVGSGRQWRPSLWTSLWFRQSQKTSVWIFDFSVQETSVNWSTNWDELKTLKFYSMMLFILYCAKRPSLQFFNWAFNVTLKGERRAEVSQ